MTALRDNTFCDNGRVPCPHCPTGSPLGLLLLGFKSHSHMGPEASGRTAWDQSLLSRGLSCRSKVTGMRVPGGREPCWPPPSPGVLSEGLRVDSEQMEGGWGGRQSAEAGPAHQACAALSIHVAGGPDLLRGMFFYVDS